MRRLSPDAAWSEGEWMLWHMDYALRSLIWSLGDHKKHPSPKPRPLDTPSQAAAARRRRDNALLARAEIDSAFGM